MLNRTIKVVGISLATTIGLAVTANHAQALDFSFNNFNIGSNTISGTFSVDDSAINPGTTTNLTISDFDDWEITSVGSGGTFTMYGPGGTFGTPNSSFLDGFNFGYPEDFSTDGSSLTMSGFLLVDSLDRNFNQNYFGGRTSNDFNFSQINGAPGESSSPQLPVVSSANSPTAVPFGVSTDLSIVILGGMYGASHLRKKLAANKS